jgi:drug/metabolite transporter (DMT)-like permease
MSPYYLALSCSVVAYALQNTLLAVLCRRHDLLSVVAGRGLSLAVTMAPLTALVDWHRAAGIGRVWPWMLLACVSAMVANLLGYAAVRFLAIGVANTLCMGMSALGGVTLGCLVFGERSTPAEIVAMAGILFCVGLLGLSRPAPTQGLLRSRHFSAGLGIALAFGACMSTAVVGLKKASDGGDPFLAAWLWEGGIGLLAGTLVLIRAALGRSGPRIPLADRWRVVLYSAPTLIGTGCYTWAIANGGLSRASAMISTVMVGTAVFGRLIWGERLTRWQWVLIVCSCLAVMVLNLVNRPSVAG